MLVEVCALSAHFGTDIRAALAEDVGSLKRDPPVDLGQKIPGLGSQR